jgi:hypothetical protein
VQVTTAQVPVVSVLAMVQVPMDRLPLHLKMKEWVPAEMVVWAVTWVLVPGSVGHWSTNPLMVRGRAVVVDRLLGVLGLQRWAVQVA